MCYIQWNMMFRIRFRIKYQIHTNYSFIGNEKTKKNICTLHLIHYMVVYLHLSKAFEMDSCFLWDEKSGKPQGII